MDLLNQHLLPLEPQYRERVWGGQRLRASSPPVGEAWLAYGPSRVASGPFAGRTLDELIALASAPLLGEAVARRFGPRFPLLVKLLDCADWLSVQVHPNDEQARRMVGPNEFGKTEAWYFVDTDPGARILAGVRPGVDRAALVAAIRSGRILDVAAYVDVEPGEALLVPAGMLHALGPGLLLYEIQQASDTTYRAYDWGRPASDGRRLHIEESAEVMVPSRALDHGRVELPPGTGDAEAARCPYFDLRLVRAATTRPYRADTRGRSLQIVTVVTGRASLTRGGETTSLGRFETAVVAGETGEYEMGALANDATILLASVPD